MGKIEKGSWINFAKGRRKNIEQIWIRFWTKYRIKNARKMYYTSSKLIFVSFVSISSSERKLDGICLLLLGKTRTDFVPIEIFGGTLIKA